MKNKDKLEVPKPTWNDCQTGREEQSKILTSLLMNRYDYLNSVEKAKAGVVNTFSLNINASWGKGKTFFIERWAEDLRAAGHIVLEFNAWEHDYSSDAMPSLLTSLYSQISDIVNKTRTGKVKLKKKLTKVGDGVKTILGNSAPALLSAMSLAAIGVPLAGVLTKTPDESGLDDASKKAFEKIGEGVGSEIFKAKEGYGRALGKFKINVSEFIDELKNTGSVNLPVFVFIDDLDRCKPLFSLQIIECVKHILDISGMYFVFATDTQQLQHSLGAVYGNGFDGERYLKRIFNRECILKEPDHDKFAKYLFSKENFNSAELMLENVLFPAEHNSVEEGLSVWFSLLSQAFDLDLRAQLACRDQIEDLLNIRKNEKTMVVALMHLVILWNIGKVSAEMQIKKNINNGDDLIVKNITYPTVTYDTDNAYRPTNVLIENVIGWHYKVCKKSYKELNAATNRGHTGIERNIHRQAIKFTSNMTYGDEPEKMLDYEKMFEQIKLTS